MPSQFLNPAVNLRHDLYGGSDENRLRFLRDVLAGVRAATDADTVVGLRISIDEQDPSGLPADVAVAACRSLASQGLVDYLNITTGTSASLAGSGHIVPEMSFANGYTAPVVLEVRSDKLDVLDVEAKAVAKLRHPNIVEVFDVSSEDEPEQYLVVELLRGLTLRKLLQVNGAIPPEVAAVIGVELLGAVAHAHSAGVVHRDIKPENVMIEHRADKVSCRVFYIIFF